MTKETQNTTTEYAKTGTCFWVWEDEETQYPELYKLAAYFDHRVDQVESSLCVVAVSVRTGITWDVPITCPLEDYDDRGDWHLYIGRDFLHEVFNSAHKFVEAGKTVHGNWTTQ